MCGTPLATATGQVNGLSETGKGERADELIWCIHEAIRRESQDILRRADVITLVRDARKGGRSCEIHCSRRH